MRFGLVRIPKFQYFGILPASAKSPVKISLSRDSTSLHRWQIQGEALGIDPVVVAK